MHVDATLAGLQARILIDGEIAEQACDRIGVACPNAEKRDQ